MLYKEIFSALGIAITFFAFLPYIRSILRDEIKAHVFSWIIWGATTIIVFLAQLEMDGGIGAWPIGVSGVITIFIATLAFIKRGELSITRADKILFISAMSSLPIWYFTSDPLCSVIVLTTVDVVGFGPTIRKAYTDPFTESLLFFALFSVRNLFVIIALEAYSMTTVLFPAATGVACIFLISLTLYRRCRLETKGRIYKRPK